MKTVHIKLANNWSVLVCTQSNNCIWSNNHQIFQTSSHAWSDSRLNNSISNTAVHIVVYIVVHIPLKKKQKNFLLMQTSTLPLMAASCSGVKFQLSLALGSVPCFTRMDTTSVWPKEQALWRGISPPGRKGGRGKREGGKERGGERGGEKGWGRDIRRQ